MSLSFQVHNTIAKEAEKTEWTIPFIYIVTPQKKLNIPFLAINSTQLT